jgi:hypothetical protein
MKDKLHFCFRTIPIQTRCTVIWELLATEHHRERAPYTLEYVKENLCEEHFKGMGKEVRLAFCHRMKRTERECREHEIIFDILLTT